MTFQVKDSGKREEYASGMRRDTQEGKPRFDLIDRVFLRRLAIHLAKGAEKYGEENWRLAEGEEELKRFRASAFRHLIQWLDGERDEDHAAAVAFNLAAAEMVLAKLEAKRPLEEAIHAMAEDVITRPTSEELYAGRITQ